MFLSLGECDNQQQGLEKSAEHALFQAWLPLLHLISSLANQKKLALCIYSCLSVFFFWVFPSDCLSLVTLQLHDKE